MSIKARVKGLARNAKSDERRKVIQDAANRLVDRSGMGTEYKVLGLTSHRETPHEHVWPFRASEKVAASDGAERASA